MIIGRNTDFFNFFWKMQLPRAWVQNEVAGKIFDEYVFISYARKLASPAIWFTYNYKNVPTGQFHRFWHVKFDISWSMCVDKILFFSQNILGPSYTTWKTTFATNSKLFFEKKFLTLHPIIYPCHRVPPRPFPPLCSYAKSSTICVL